jgi:hypothetical protein
MFMTEGAPGTLQYYVENEREEHQLNYDIPLFAEIFLKENQINTPAVNSCYEICISVVFSTLMIRLQRYFAFHTQILYSSLHFLPLRYSMADIVRQKRDTGIDKPEEVYLQNSTGECGEAFADGSPSSRQRSFSQFFIIDL